MLKAPLNTNQPNQPVAIVVYDAFYEAVDEDRLYEFLGLERPGKSSSQLDQSAVDQVEASGETYTEEIQTTIAVETKLQPTTS